MNRRATMRRVAAAQRAAAPVLRFGALTGQTESGNASSGWAYTGTASFTGSTASSPSLTLASGANGGWWGTATVNVGGSGIGCIVGFRTSAAAGVFNTVGTYALYRDADGIYHTITNGTSGGTADATVSGVSGDAIRIRRSDTLLIAEVSKDNRATWLAVHAWAGFTTAQIWPWLGMSTSDVFSDCRSFGLI